MPPARHPGLNRTDLVLFLRWLPLQALLGISIGTLFWILHDKEKWDVSWSLIMLSAALPVAAKRGQYLLLLGLISLALFAKALPLTALYCLSATIPLYSLLKTLVWSRWKEKRSIITIASLFGLSLVGFFVLLPLLFESFFETRPSWWAGWNPAIGGALILLYAYYAYHCWSRRQLHGYFEHLAYVFFLPQRTLLLAIHPRWFFETQRLGVNRTNYGKAWKSVLIAALKTGVFWLISLWYQPTSWQIDSFFISWLYLIIHYVIWILWITASFDLVIALARMLGLPLPSVYHLPLIARSFSDWWYRFNRYSARFSIRLFRQFSQQSKFSGFSLPLRVGMSLLIVLTLLPLGSFGSIFLLSSGSQWVSWILFTLPFALLLMLESHFSGRGFERIIVTGFPTIVYAMTCQLILAFLHFFLLNQGLFPLDPVWTWEERFDFLQSLSGFTPVESRS
ncbi:MAG: hypothetical protein AAFY98_10370 [Verrucomicrobiota bacterium]